MTYSISSNSWLDTLKSAGFVLFSSVLESSATVYPPTKPQLWWIIPPERHLQISMDGEEGFHILLNSGEKFSSGKSGTFIISKRQLDLLQAAGIPLTILNSHYPL